MKNKLAKMLLPRSLFTLMKNAYILGFKLGQFKSAQLNSSVDQDGLPIPWYSYPAIEYIHQLDFSKKRIFEYGSGNSTLFWAKQCAWLVSVEDNEQWYQEIKSKIASNVIYHLTENRDEYIQSIKYYPHSFDVIIIDGNYRLECAEEAVKKITKNGMIILDNADWHEKTTQLLRDADLIQVDMAGFSPINPYTITTSFFLTRDFSFTPINDRQPIHGIGSKPIRREVEDNNT
jgi:hypothetical protein